MLAVVVMAHPASPPSAPSNLSAPTSTQTEIRLQWADNSNNETGFRIEAAQVLSTSGTTSGRDAPISGDVSGAIAFRQIGTVGPVSCSPGISCIQRFTHTGLSPATTYRYQVRAFNTEGASAPSNVATGMTLPRPPAAPTNLVVTEVTPPRITMRWLDNSDNELAFEVVRDTVRLADTVTKNMFYDFTAPPNSNVTYRVRARNRGGFSAFSNTAVVTTPAPLLAPTNVSAKTQSSSVIKLTWQYTGARTGFRIYRATGTSTTFNQLRDVAGTVTEIDDTGLPASSTFSYRIRTLYGSYSSNPSFAATATTAPGTPDDSARDGKAGRN
jgi:hypothetical protein